MGKKTMVPINLKGKDYIVVKGSTSSSSSPTLRFDNKIAALFYRHSSKVSTGYYANESVDFWQNGKLGLFNNTNPPSNPIGYDTGSGEMTITKIDDYAISFKYNLSGSYVVYYVAILENDATTASHPIFLLSNSILYTDGTVTSEVAGAIQTLETNKYKIKVNALVTITGATYANISN